MRTPLVAALVAGLTSIAASPARAWGPDGHVVVARVAEAHLTPKTRKALVVLLDGRRLADEASWADDWRQTHPETSRWHYVNIPLDAKGYDAARDCAGGECIVAALTAQLAVLRDPHAALTDRRRALRFVVHFVGDLHQPLHDVADTSAPGGTDHGGNDVKARLTLTDAEFPFQSPPSLKSSLHGVWDLDLVDSEHREQEAFVAALERLPAAPDPLAAGPIVAWANEAHDLARDVAYKDLPAPDPTGVRQLGDAYAARCRGTVERQLLHAGLRLARLLNESFQGP